MVNLPLAYVEPHAGLLKLPPPGQRLFKVMKVSHLLDALRLGYLHFTRVDQFKDFDKADLHDGEELPADRDGNTSAKFLKDTSLSASDYYQRCREQTFACCFSTENSDYIWENYANGDERGKACLVFDFDKLRNELNALWQTQDFAVVCGGIRSEQIFSINYGLIDYVEWKTLCANKPHLPNPVQYTYYKDSELFAQEQELRISLAPFGPVRNVIRNGQPVLFPANLQLHVNIRAGGIVTEILHGPECDTNYLFPELEKIGVQKN